MEKEYEYPAALVFSAEERASRWAMECIYHPNLVGHDEDALSLEEYVALTEHKATRVSGQIREIALKASTRVLAAEGIQGMDDVCWKLLLERLEDKEVANLAEVLHICYMALGQSTPRPVKQMRKVWKHLPGLIAEQAKEATDEEIIFAVKDCFHLNARDMHCRMVRAIIHSPDPQRIICALEGYHSGYTTIDGVLRDARKYLEEKQTSHP